MPQRRLLPTLLPLCCSLACASAGHLAEDATDYYTPSVIRYADHVYDPLVRTVQLYKLGFELSAPILELGSTDQLELRFDDMRPTTHSLSFAREAPVSSRFLFRNPVGPSGITTITSSNSDPCAE